MFENATVDEMKQMITIALGHGATPSLSLVQKIRGLGEEQAKWLDDTYCKFRRPELVGDDKDGLVLLLMSEKIIRRRFEKCKTKEDVIKWFKIIKMIEPMPWTIRIRRWLRRSHAADL